MDIRGWLCFLLCELRQWWCHLTEKKKENTTNVQQEREKWDAGEITPRCPAVHRKVSWSPGAHLSSQLLHLWSESPSPGMHGQGRKVSLENPTEDPNKGKHSMPPTLGPPPLAGNFWQQSLSSNTSYSRSKYQRTIVMMKFDPYQKSYLEILCVLYLSAHITEKPTNVKPGKKG